MDIAGSNAPQGSGRPWTRLSAVGAGLVFTVVSAALAGTVTTVTVKETSGVGATDFPTTVVIPLPEGRYQTTAGFSLGVPAQFQVLERWATKDGSIRHVAAHFQSTVAANGTAAYTFRDDGTNPAPPDPVQVTDGASLITVTTGPLKFTIDKTSFDILDTVWLDRNGDRTYSDSERVVLPSTAAGGRFDGCTNVTSGSCTPQAQNDASLPAPTFTIEESGPMRAVIRAELPTSYSGPNSHRHGYAVRIYAYAGRSDVKIDYQLQNSAKGPALDSGKFAGPLYFNALTLDWALQLSGTVTVRTGKGDGTVDSRVLDSQGVELAQTLHDRYQIRSAAGSNVWVNCTNDCYADGFMDVSDSSWGVTAFVRNMWEMWPGGIQVAGDDALSIQLWPDWSEMWNYGSGAFYGTGLYWLDDMRQVYKEVYLDFHGASVPDASLVAYAKTADRYPVPTIPVSWYRQTAVTLDLDGLNPLTTRAGSDRQLETNSASDLDETNGSGYRMGWNRWFADYIPRLSHPCETGGGPASAEWFIATESPDRYWDAERLALGELNVRPEWMADDYRYATDYDRVLLNQDPYCGGDWRDQGDTATYRIPGSARTNTARDDPHDWTYHVLDFYWYSANPWVRDWARFLGEFRRANLAWRTGQALGGEEREIGHAMKDVIAAYRMTGDVTLIDGLADMVADHLLPSVSPLCGELSGSIGASNMIGFQDRVLQSALREFKGYDWQRWAEIFQYVSAYTEGHYRYSKYSYNPGQCVVGSGSSGTAWNTTDAVAHYYWITGKTKFKTQNETYVTQGLNGARPYQGDDLFCPDPGWDGCYARRVYDYVASAPRPDSTPPAAITNVSATMSGSTVTATWTAPSDAAYYLVVWSDKPIVEAYSSDTANQRNWWAAHPVGTGTNHATFDVGTSGTVYVAVFGFDGADNMSAMSNVAATDGSTPTTPPATPQNLRVN